MSTKTLSILKGLTSWGGVITTLCGISYGISKGGDVISYSITLFGVILSSAGHWISSAQARHQKAVKEAAEAKISEARIDATAAKQVADELLRRASNRTITDEQRDQLFSSLQVGPKGRVIVTFLSVERDAQKYAEQIVSILVKTGFDVTLSKYIWLQLALDGVYITAKEKGKVPIHGAFIQNCFREAGIQVRGFYDPKFLKDVGASDDSIVFAVSNRH